MARTSNELRVNINNNHLANYQFDKILLPLKKKRLLLKRVPHLNEEYNCFLNILPFADEIYLVGKNFILSDVDVAEDIRGICSKLRKMHVVYINPDSTNPHKQKKWIEQHNSIFNVSTYECYGNLPQYINKSGL